MQSDDLGDGAWVHGPAMEVGEIDAAQREAHGGGAVEAVKRTVADEAAMVGSAMSSTWRFFTSQPTVRSGYWLNIERSW